MKKKIIFLLLLVFCFELYPVQVQASAVNALGTVGGILGIVVDVLGDSNTQRQLDAINNKLDNDIPVTDEEFDSVIEALQNLSYNGSGALMKTFSGVAKNNYSTSWRSYELTAEVTNDFSYFCWIDNVLYCCALDKDVSYQVCLNIDSTTWDYSGGSSAGTSYGTLHYMKVGYKADDYYGWTVTNYQNAVAGAFDSFQDVAKAISSSKRKIECYSTVQQNYDKGFTKLKISGAYKPNGKTLSDYNYDWKSYIKDQGLTVISENPDTGDTVVNYNYGDEPATEPPTVDIVNPDTFDPDDYKVSISDKFPFCIPYDIYDFLTCLAAEPEAPAFNFIVPLSSFGLKDYEFVINLKQLDSVAFVFRKMELLGFCVGLALVTKKMIN